MSVTFLKKGKEAKEALAKEEAKDDAKNKEYINRFWLPDGGTGQLLFVDGNLDADGLLDIPMLYEHQLHLNGHWRNWFVCTQDNEPCPMCEGGDTPSYVGVMTVIDMRTHYVDKHGNEKENKGYGKRMLFVAKKNTIKQLNAIASKRNGLTGCLIDVTRSGEKAANVGDVFDVLKKVSKATIVDKFGELEATPFKYEEVFVYKSAKELRKMGFGVSTPIGGEVGVTEETVSAGTGPVKGKGADSLSDDSNEYDDAL